MSDAGSGAGDIFDVKKVRQLIELMKEHDLAEIDLRQAEQRIKLRRGGEPIVGMMAPALAALRRKLVRLREARKLRRPKLPVPIWP